MAERTKLAASAALFVFAILSVVPRDVTSFSVGGASARMRAAREARKLELADALSSLQRNRRRVGGDYLRSVRLPDDRALTADDVRDWLEQSRDVDLGEDNLGDFFVSDDVDPTWVSDGDFKDFQPEPKHLAVKPTKQEIDDIFSDDDNEDVSIDAPEVEPQQKIVEDRKKKSVAIGMQKKLVKKSVATDVITKPTSSNDKISLSSLTQEEFKALMKAVGKLQKQVDVQQGPAKKSVKEESQPEEEESGFENKNIISQPASKEEVDELFSNDDSPDRTLIQEYVSEEEVNTPEGGMKTLEVHGPQGGRRFTEITLPDGEKNFIEETLPEKSVNLKEALENSEQQLSDAIATQLEEDISEEARKDELEAEVEEEAANVIAKVAQEEVEKEEKDALDAAENEIAGQIGADNLATLEKLWMAPPVSQQKRTAKRAARKFGQESSSMDNISLQDLVDVASLLDDGSDDVKGAIVESPEDLGEDALDRETIRNALTAFENTLGGEAVAYGSPLTGNDLQLNGKNIDENDDDSDMDDNTYTINLESDSPISLEAKRSGKSDAPQRKITKARLEELARTLSLEPEEDDIDDEDDEDTLYTTLPDESEDSLEDTDEFDLDPTSGINLIPANQFHFPREVTSLPPPLGRFVTKLVELEDELGKLKLFAQLADLENDVLTDALNEATLAQKPGTVNDKEFDSLQQAILLEKELQKLKTGDDIREIDFIPPSPMPSKKGEPWRRKRGGGADTAIETFPGVNIQEIERLLGEAHSRKGTLPQLDDFDMDEEGNIASIFLPDAEQCAAVTRYSTNCGLADLYGLPVDYEARALCNLHEMCYACGNSLSVQQSSCDQVYRVAARTLCRDEKACVLEAEIFLRTMKLKTRYVPYSQPVCRSTCTAQFLGML